MQPAVRIVIPLYRPDLAAVDNLRAAAGQAPVIAVDDGSGPSYDEILTVIEATGATLIRLPANAGIAAALNAGVTRAIGDGADHVLTLDQDTRLDSDAVLRLVERLHRLPAGARAAAAIGPGRVAGVSYRGEPGPMPGLLDVQEALQSGLLIPASAVTDVGAFKEDLVIDGVDTQWCLRARARGQRILVDTQVGMTHRLGNGEASPRFRVGRWSPRATGHSPLRRYYITRNRLRLLREFGRQEWRWALVFLRRLIVGTLLAVTIEDQRAAKLRSVVLGALDAARGRTGPAPPSVAGLTAERRPSSSR
jgi:rhamnosyltransferase